MPAANDFLELSRREKIARRVFVPEWSFGDGLALVGPIVLAAIVLLFSPNFDSTKTVRTSPLGSDFLQDWIGAKIVTSPNRHLLYDSSHSQALQHDQNVVGFQWPQEMYYPMVYPPFFYSLLRPLAQLPYFGAICCWVGLLGISLSATFALLRNFGPTRNHYGKFVFASLVYAPLLLSFNMAHKSVFLLLIFTASFVLMHDRKPLSAGMAFGLLAFKPHLGLLLGFALLIKGQWKFVLGSLITVSLLIMASLACGLDLCWDFLQQSLAASDYINHGGYRLEEAVNLNAAAQNLLGNSSWMAQILAGIVSIFVVAVLIVIMQGRLEPTSDRFAVQYSALMFATPLLSPHFYIYDLTIMLLPMLLFMLGLAGDGAADTKHARGKFTMYTLAVFFFASGVFSSVAATTGIQLASVLLILLIWLAMLHLKLEGRHQHGRCALPGFPSKPTSHI